MGIGRMVMVFTPAMAVVSMAVLAVAVVPMGNGDAIGLAGTGALELTEGAALD